MNSRIDRARRYVLGIAGLKAQDCILASFPKSGNTWIRFFLCNLVSLNEWGGAIVNFETLNRTMPELGVSNLLAPWPYHTIPRVIKTHKRCWPIFRAKRSILVIRDPRDVMISAYHYYQGLREPRFQGSFSALLRNGRYGLPAWFKHYCSWSQSSAALIRYENLKKNDVAEFSRLLEALSIEVNPEMIIEAAERAKLRNVRYLEDRYGRGKPGYHKEGARFARSGRSGLWRDVFSDDDVAYYRHVKEQYQVDVY